MSNFDEMEENWDNDDLSYLYKKDEDVDTVEIEEDFDDEDPELKEIKQEIRNSYTEDELNEDVEIPTTSEETQNPNKLKSILLGKSREQKRKEKEEREALRQNQTFVERLGYDKERKAGKFENFVDEHIPTKNGQMMFYGAIILLCFGALIIKHIFF